MFKNIIFDWSGVIKDALESQFFAINKIFEKAGIEQITFDEMRNNWEQPYMRFYNKYAPDWTIEFEQKLYHEVINRKDFPKSKACPGMVDLIKKIKEKGLSMVVLSSDPVAKISAEVKDYGLENIFDEIFADVYDKAEKIHELISKNNFKAEETVFIGDSNHEIEVGKIAGIKTIAVTWGFSTAEKLKSYSPDFLVNNTKELEKILLE